MRCDKRPREGTSGHHRALNSLVWKAFSFFFSFNPGLHLHIYDITSVGMMTIPCREALQSLEFNESALHRKENLFWSGLLCLGPHFQSLELKLVSDSVVSDLWVGELGPSESFPPSVLSLGKLDSCSGSAGERGLLG